jgi:hypothetical protein
MSVRPVSRDVNKAGGIDGPELFEPPIDITATLWR